MLLYAWLFAHTYITQFKIFRWCVIFNELYPEVQNERMGKLRNLKPATGYKNNIASWLKVKTISLAPESSFPLLLLCLHLNSLNYILLVLVLSL